MSDARAQDLAPLQVRLETYYREKQGRNFSIAEVTPISGGWETEVYSFRIVQEIDYFLILRLYPGMGAAEKCLREFDGLNTLYYERYPAPEPSYYETDPKWLGKPFLIMDKISGQPLGKMIQENPARQTELLTYFCDLFADLHQLDYHPFLAANTDLSPADLIRRKFSEGRALIVDQFQQTWAIPVFDWLEDRLSDVLKTASLSVIHNDFHPYNVLLTPEDQAYVIDWSLIEVNDYRFDLGWTLILAARRSLEQRANILSEYERLRGQPVDHIEYFEVIGALRRLVDLSVSLTHGADSLGMRPDTIEIMRRQHNDYQQVYDLMCKYTGLRLPKIERLLATLKGST